MRREFLQFKDEGKPSALFESELNPEEPITARNLKQLVQTLRISGAEMLHDLIISFCWQQIAPQLENASRQIRVGMAQDVIQSLDLALQRFNGPEERNMKAALVEALGSVFSKVASWFQVPQTGFVPASIDEICNIIDIEQNRPASATATVGDRLSTKYYGISVHRIYDCLAVLLQNAYKHGDEAGDVSVHVESTPIDGTNLHTVRIVVSSRLAPDDAGESSQRVNAAITSFETASDMVTEGYSGIKKVKFITRLNEGAPTVSYEVTGETMKIGFSLKAEIARGDSSYDESFAG
jgi:hypothetical protein